MITQLINILWVSSAVILTLLSRIYFSNTSTFVGGYSYIALGTIWGLSVFGLSRLKAFPKFQLSMSAFIIGVVTIFFGGPLFENDHFRYLWEGGVFLKGYNPYLFSPESNELAHLPFSFKEQIGFPHLTTVYPPLGIVWFGIGGIFENLLGFKFSVIILMALNGFLVWWLLDKLKILTKPWLLVSIIPFLQKEFIQAIHIDLLAACFFFVYLIEIDSPKLKKHILFITLSVWTKLLGLAALPVLLWQFRKNGKWVFVLIIPILLFFVLTLLTHNFESISGIRAFSENWVWNPGFYSLLTKTFGLGEVIARRTSLICFGLSLIGIGINMLTHFLKNSTTKRQIYIWFYLIFSCLMFFSPVFNGWYGIWFLLPALLLNLNTGVFYAIFSCWGYIHYGLEDYHSLAEFMTHIWFLFSLIELWKDRSALVSTRTAGST